MDDQHPGGKVRRPRWRLGTLMLAIAGVGVACALARPFATPAPVRAARAVLEAYTAELDPAFRSEDYRADSVQRTPAGYLQVRFIRVAGNGLPERVVAVPAQAVARARLNPWWAPSNGATQRTRSAGR